MILCYIFFVTVVFPYIKGENQQLILVREHQNHITKRVKVTPLPDELSVSFTSSHGDVTLRLRRNVHVNHNVPVTFEDGSSPVDADSSVDNVAVYQDTSKRACVSVTAELSNNRYVRSLEGSFITDGKYYLIEPVHETVDDLIKVLDSRGLNHNEGVPHLLTEKRLYVKGKTDKNRPPDYSGRNKMNKLPKAFPNVPHIPDALKNAKLRRLSRLLDLLARRRLRTRRSTTVLEYSVEVLLLLDHTVWERFMALSKNDETAAVKRIKYYYSHIMNGIDLAYSSIDPIENGYSIDVWLKGYRIAKTKAESMLTVPFLMEKQPTGTVYRNIGINGTQVLDNLAKWHVSGGRKWYNPDHAMLITRYNIFKAATIGYAPVAGICTQNGNSLLEDIGFHSWLTATHELGHNLGAGHDGIKNTCDRYSRYIMAPSAGYVEGDKIENVYKFSACSIRDMKTTIMGTGPSGYLQIPRVCLHNKVCSHVDFSADIATLPGQKFTATQQCQTRFGLKSYSCNANKASSCLFLTCRDHTGTCKRWAPGAADGTPCGDNKWCFHGQCIVKTTRSAGSGGGTCKPTQLSVPTPAGCGDTPYFRIRVKHPDGTFSAETCDGLSATFPFFCFTIPAISKHCCVSCHKLGLVKNAHPAVVITTPQPQTSTTTSTITIKPPAADLPVLTSPSTAPSTSTESVCIDELGKEECELWKSNNYCKVTYVKFMALNCKKTCGKCNAESTTTSTTTTTTTTKAPETSTLLGGFANCADIYESNQCDELKDYGYCTAASKWMFANCKKSCGHC